MSLHVRDLAERALLCALVGWLAWRIGASIVAGETSWVSMLVLAGEILVLIFVLIGRKATDVTTRPSDWLLAFAGAAAPLLVTPGGEQLVPTSVIASLFLFGFVAQIAAKISLNFSFGLVPANRGVVSGGLYKFVRHPVYASYLIGHVAFLLANPTGWNAFVYSAALALQIGRLLAEERLLCRDPAYVAYQQAVRYRLLPGVF